MSLQQSGISAGTDQLQGTAFLQLGFRPFFAGAAIYAIISIFVWMGVYQHGWSLVPVGMPASLWHAHELIYGYALAVIAGFLLAAVKNWTGESTVQGAGLLILFLLWVFARVAFLAASVVPLQVAAALDTLFLLGVLVAISLPIIKVRQWKQLGIVSKILLMLIFNSIFYLAALASDAILMGQAVYFGLYLVLALIFVMARRVIPFFIQNGVEYPVKLKNPLWLDISSLVLFVLFVIYDVLDISDLVTAVLAGLLAVLHSVRLLLWYTPGIWKKPLLWVLYLAYASIVAGFVLSAATAFVGSSYFLAVHAFTVGGIGLLTLGMMSRVTLGHTGRNVFDPPSGLGVMFALMLAAAIVRVLLPLFDMSRYPVWVAVSQWLWIVAFSLFLLRFLPMLIRARVDGRAG